MRDSFTAFASIELNTIFSQLTTIFVSSSPHAIVRSIGRFPDDVTAANRQVVDLVVVATGAMLATSRTAGWREAGLTAAESLLVFSCIPVSLSIVGGDGRERERERERGEGRERRNKADTAVT